MSAGMARPKTPKRKRATTVERAKRALEHTSTNEPTPTDDPSRDKTTKKAGVIQPLKHAD
jgi:hypothetical protein